VIGFSGWGCAPSTTRGLRPPAPLTAAATDEAGLSDVRRAGRRLLRIFGGGKHLRAIKTQKQVSDGVAHSQREQAPPPVLFTIVKHVATLTKGLQISQSVICGIMVKVRRRQRHFGCANCDVVANSSSKAGQRPSASVAPRPFVFIPPSTIA
jgi:hypothetical protein